MSNVVPLNAHTIAGFTDHFLAADYDERAPTPQCHLDWWTLATSDHPRVAFAAPRKHAKSTAVNHAFGLAASLFQQHPFQLKVSKTYALACEKIEQAKETLVSNERIKHIFKLKRIVRDRENDFIAEMADGYQFRMMALGMGQATRGLSWGTVRPTLIQGDDMEDDEEVLNPERREKAWRWFFNTLLPMGSDRCKIRIYGTILHNESLLKRLIEMPSWHGKVWAACDEQISGESILWPQKFTPDVLADIKRTYVEAGNLVGFNMEYRNIALDTSSGFFRPEDFRERRAEDEDKTLLYYCGVDFAISTKEGRDYTVIVVAGLDAEGFLHVVDLYRGRWDGMEIIDQMLAVEKLYHPEEWFVEEGAIRKALGPAMELRMREEDGTGVYMNLAPIVPTKDKSSRARSMQARMRAKAVRFAKDASWYADLEQECLQFPRGGHDDQVDALAIIGLGLAKMSAPLTQEEEDEIDRDAMRKEHLTFGRSAVTGY